MIHINGSINSDFNKQSQVPHGDNEFICGEQHDNSIEHFWNFAKNID